MSRNDSANEEAEPANEGGDTAIVYAPADDAPKEEAPSAPADARRDSEIVYDAEQKEEPQPVAQAAQEVELQALAAGVESDDTSGFVGKYFRFESGGKFLSMRLQALSEVPPDSTSENLQALTSGTASGGEVQERKKTVEEIQKEEIDYLVPDSTNSWLFINDSHLAEDSGDDTGLGACLANCSDNCANKFIAIFVIVIQIAAYIAMTAFLRKSRQDDFDSREESCYGPNCHKEPKFCMSFGTGGLTSVLLVGFLWADVVNTLSLMTKNKRWALASLLVLFELFTSIVCGYLVGVYSESDFDAIGGAVGILFVHDLDEKVFASMQVFRGTKHATLKKILAITFWIVISIVVAFAVACHFEDDALVGSCLSTEFSCASGSTNCVWEGFVCNGVSDCDDGSDEFSGRGHDTCDYSLIVCPGSDAATYDEDCEDDDDSCHSEEPSHFMCESDGACIPYDKRCNGVIDCDDGSDEGRAQNCQTVISKIKCDEVLNITTLSDGYSQKWTGNFKCNNGQCIDAQYACDGTPDDCVDGSDEYPDFNKARESPWKVACPYAALIDCASDEVLCKLDGRCIGKSAVCDGIKDCADGADEKNCEYSCQTLVKKQKKFQCGGNIAGVNDTHVIQWFNNSDSSLDANSFTVEYANADWDTLFQGVSGACVPVSWRCDGTSDCDDNTDEELCSLFSCSDSEYQCTDTGSCITTSWLCDGISDCMNGEDETSSICAANGVSTSGNTCTANGYFYQCNGCTSCCLYSYQMCDGYSDCPYGDDEETDNCDAAWSAATSTTTSYSPSSGTGLSCGDTQSGSTSYGYYYYSFTAGSESQVMISGCNDNNQGEIYFSVFGDDSTYYYSSVDWDCGCSNRGILIMDSLTSGYTYTITAGAGFTGNYEFDITCGSGLSSPVTCTASQSAFTTSSYYYYGYP